MSENFLSLTPFHRGLDTLRQLLSGNTTGEIIILPHYDPDTDAMAASLVWAAYLKKKGHAVKVISVSPFITDLCWLQHINEVLVLGDTIHENELRDLLNKAPLVCCIDYSRADRLQDAAHLLAGISCPVMIADHHLEPEDFASVMYHTTAAPSTTTLILHLIHTLGDASLIDADMAAAMYGGLISDTAFFSNSRAGTIAFLTAAHLLQWKIDPALIYRFVNGDLSLQEVQLLGYILQEKIIIPPYPGVCYILLTANELRRFNVSLTDTDVYLKYAIRLKGIRMAVMMVEYEGFVKVSVRTRDALSAADFARQYFHGGGHRNAAGAALKGYSIEEAETLLLNALSSADYSISNIKLS